MDLLATVRKEGSRGGRGEFKWSDVQSSSHRENYLGHSLMAPVGRWQKGRDLSWYAKSGADSEGDEDSAARAARERKEEIQRVKEAEEDALARALGLPVAPRNNPNMEELGAQREVGKVLKEAAEDNDTTGSRGVGYGRAAGMTGSKESESTTERLEGSLPEQDTELQHALKEYRRRHGDRRRRSRSSSRDRIKDSGDRKRHRDHGRRHRDRRSRSPRRDRYDSRRSRSPSPDKDRNRHRRERSRSRSTGERGYERNHRRSGTDRRRERR